MDGGTGLRDMIRAICIIFYLSIYIVLLGPVLAIFRLFSFRKSESPMSPPVIVYFSSVQWFEVWQRPQHCASRLKGSYTVFYVSPLPLHHVLNDVFGWFKKRVYRHSENLYVYSPILISGENRFHVIRLINRFLIICYMTELFLRFKMVRPVIWMNNPFYTYLLDKFPSRLVVYDIMDEYTKFSIAPRDVNELENNLLRQAKVAFTGTNSLYKQKKNSHENISFVPCGVDYDLFNSAEGNKLQPAPDISGIKHPVIGYIGGLNERIDSDLIEYIAEKRRDWTLLLVGPIQRSFELSGDHENILFTGLKPYKELPNYLTAFDVCILPYRMSEATYFINPVKLLEYMAAGKPLVSVPIPDIIEFYGDYIEIAQDHDAFLEAIDRAVKNPNLEKVRSGLELSRTKSWDTMVDTMLDKVTKELHNLK